MLCNAYGVESAGLGFSEPALARIVTFFNCAKAVLFFVEVAECTFLSAIHEGSDQVAVAVYFKKAFLFHGAAALPLHFVLEIIVVLFYGRSFRFLKRGSAVTYDTAFSLAFFVVAGEKIKDDILGNKDVIYLDNRAELHF